MIRPLTYVAFLIFALAPTRAKIFAQETKSGMYDRLVREAIDSVLNAHGLSTKNTGILFETGIQVDSTLLNSVRDDNIIFIRDLSRNQRVIRTSEQGEEGEYSITGKYAITKRGVSLAELNGLVRNTLQRTRRYSLNLIESDSPHSFWDSTAKPILVTIGAAVVIALFFLIRG
ncbi:MAG: hypothetical protein WCH46_07740 [bacterium]